MDFLYDILINYGYLGMFLIGFLAGSFIPFSSETVMTALLAAGLHPAGPFRLDRTLPTRKASRPRPRTTVYVWLRRVDGIFCLSTHYWLSYYYSARTHAQQYLYFSYQH